MKYFGKELEIAIQDIVKSQAAFWRSEGRNPFVDGYEGDEHANYPNTYADGLIEVVIEHEAIYFLSQEIAHRLKDELAKDG